MYSGALRCRAHCRWHHQVQYEAGLNRDTNSRVGSVNSSLNVIPSNFRMKVWPYLNELTETHFLPQSSCQQAERTAASLRDWFQSRFPNWGPLCRITSGHFLPSVYSRVLWVILPTENCEAGKHTVFETHIFFKKQWHLPNFPQEP